MTNDAGRHQTKPFKGLLKTVRYGASHEGHDVEIEFDRKNPVLNAARLLVDGELIDKKRLFYGEKELTATANDGTKVVVSVDSGMIGELTRAQLKGSDGAWIDLEERPGTA